MNMQQTMTTKTELSVPNTYISKFTQFTGHNFDTRKYCCKISNEKHNKQTKCSEWKKLVEVRNEKDKKKELVTVSLEFFFPYWDVVSLDLRLTYISGNGHT